MQISRSKRIGIAAVAVAALPATLLTMNSTNAADSTSQAETFRLVERDAHFRHVDLPPRERAPSVGDEFVITAKLNRSGERVGRLHAVCTITQRALKAHRIFQSCVGTLDLRRGTIELAVGGIVSERDFEIAVTGGTGKYAGASGTVEVTQVHRRTVYVVQLMP